MTLVICWLVYPAVLALLACGLGLLAEVAGRFRLPASLLMPLGFALMVVIATLATLSGSTAKLATPALVVLALAGFALGARGREWRIRSAGVAAVLAVFAVAAAPVVFTGQAGFAGYTQLDDISTFLAFAARAADHGRDLSGLQPSTYEATLAVNLDTGYPLGAFVPLSATGRIVGQDLAWLWQPYLTFMVAMLALALWALARPVVRDERLRAAAVFVAAQPALLYAYVLQGGVKELAATTLVAVGAALGVELPSNARLVAPFVAVCGALLCVLSLGSVAYVGPLALAVLVVALLLPGWRARAVAVVRRRPRVVALAGLVAVGAAVAVVGSTSDFRTGGEALLQNKTDIGNLFHALDWKQVFGIWPAGDFRNGVGDGKGLAYLLIVVLAAAGAGGAVTMARRRQFGPLLFGAATLVALVGLSTYGSSPWVEAKALAIASPAVLLLAALGATLWPSRLRPLAFVSLGLIAVGVAWSNWLAYHDVKLAPRDRLAELATIGDRFAGDGPTMINEYEPYGARYFLRETDPEAPAELRRRVVPLRSGEGLGKNQWAPVDEFQLPAVLVYRTIVLRRSPAESRPPAAYTLRFSGRFYDVWQRPEQVPTRVVTYSIFGDQLNAGALPPCKLVGQLATTARQSHARLVAAVRAPAVVVDQGTGARPPTWPFSQGPPTQLYPDSPGTARLPVSVHATGAYDAWVQGSFARGLELSIDGKPLGSTRDELSFTGQWIRFGSGRELSAGPHTVELRYPGGSLRPGAGQQPETVGPLALAPRAPRSELLDVAPGAARSLCTKPLDWLEVVAR
jgi:hypothetical protein